MFKFNIFLQTFAITFTVYELHTDPDLICLPNDVLSQINSLLWVIITLWLFLKGKCENSINNFEKLKRLNSVNILDI